MIFCLVVHPILHIPIHPWCQAHHQFIEKIGNSKREVAKATHWSVVGENVISIEPMERNYLRFLWYDDVFSDFPKLKGLRFARVIFGVTSSHFRLNGNIRKHIGNYKYDKVLVEKIENSFYVDDFSGGGTSFETAIELYKELRARFAEGYFKLRKCRTNDANLRKLLSETAQNDIKPGKV